MTLNKGYKQVKEFHDAFSHPVAKEVVALEGERAVNRSVWTGEEVVEFIQASSKDADDFLQKYEDFIGGLEKAKEKSLKAGFPATEKEKVIAQSDALVDALYFIFGSFVEMGVEPDNLFTIVHEANMSKLFTAEDGTRYAKYRESDGKIEKSPDFFPPEGKIAEEIERQIGG